MELGIYNGGFNNKRRILLKIDIRFKRGARLAGAPFLFISNSLLFSRN